MFGYTIIKIDELKKLEESKKRYRQLKELLSWMGEFKEIIIMREGFFRYVREGSANIDYFTIREEMRKVKNENI